jgi:hypothetical protein
VWWPGANISLTSQLGDSFSVVKTYSWGFWYATGIAGALFLACALILLYLIISSATIYQYDRTNRKNQQQQKSAGDHIHLGRHQHNLLGSSSHVYQNNSGNFINGFKTTAEDEFKPSNVNAKASKIYQNGAALTGASATGPIDPDNVNLDLAVRNNHLISGSQISSTGNHRSSSSNLRSSSATTPQLPSYMSHDLANSTTAAGSGSLHPTEPSPSYIFYTGNGQYRKQSIQLENEAAPTLIREEDFDPPPPPPVLNSQDFLQQNHLISYSQLLMQNGGNHQDIVSNTAIRSYHANHQQQDHQYSNLPTDHAASSNDFKLTTYR